jgi:putative transposase
LYRSAANVSVARIDDEGQVLDLLVQSKRGTHAALRLMCNLLKTLGLTRTGIVTDRYHTYDAALQELGLSHLHVVASV